MYKNYEDIPFVLMDAKKASNGGIYKARSSKYVMHLLEKDKYNLIMFLII